MNRVTGSDIRSTPLGRDTQSLPGDHNIQTWNAQKIARYLNRKLWLSQRAEVI